MKKEDFEKVIKAKQILLDKLTKLINLGIKTESKTDYQYRVLEELRLGCFILKDFKCEKNELKVLYDSPWNVEWFDFPYTAIENEETFKKWIIETNNKLKILAEREQLLKLKEERLKKQEQEKQEKELYLKLKTKYEGATDEQN